MFFSLPEEKCRLREAAERFAEQEIAPLDAKMDNDNEIDRSLLDKLGAAGYFGLIGPREYGGGGIDAVGMALCIEEIARASGSVAVTLDGHWLCLEGLLRYGSEEQKRTFLPDLCSGAKIGAFSWTEPSAGSDAAGIRARAVRSGDSYIIHGTKRFCTNGDLAGTVLVGAVTDPSAGAGGLSIFIVDSGSRGMTVGRRENKMGLRGSHTTELVFEGVAIPACRLLGVEGAGFKMAMGILNLGRIIVGALCVGSARAALEASIVYAKERRAFGRPIANQQAIQFMLAEMNTNIAASRLLVLRAATLAAGGKPYHIEAAQAKYFASEMAMRVCSDAVQIHGGYGYTKDYDVERYFRNAKFAEIGEGTTQVLKLLIARSTLKLGGAARSQELFPAADTTSVPPSKSYST
jgi:alkylation response protein AidB-like acyl-CoA dehydrogenase